MTAILKDIRRLESDRARGALTDAQFAAAKARLLDSVEDAQAEIAVPAPRQTRPQPRAPQPKADAKLGHLVIALIIGVVLCLGLSTLILQDLTLALTLTGTLCAAFVVRAYTKLEE